MHILVSRVFNDLEFTLNPNSYKMLLDAQAQLVSLSTQIHVKPSNPNQLAPGDHDKVLLNSPIPHIGEESSRDSEHPEEVMDMGSDNVVDVILQGYEEDELREMLIDRGLEVDGNKYELIQRLTGNQVR